MSNGTSKSKISRIYILPLVATAAMIWFWLKYRCAQGYWWFLAVIGLILVLHYAFFYFRKRLERKEQN